MEAESAYRKAIAIDPEYAAPWHNLGVVLHKGFKRDAEADVLPQRASLRSLKGWGIPCPRRLQRAGQRRSNIIHALRGPGLLECPHSLETTSPRIAGGIVAVSGHFKFSLPTVFSQVISIAISEPFIYFVNNTTAPFPTTK